VESRTAAAASAADIDTTTDTTTAVATAAAAAAAEVDNADQVVTDELATALKNTLQIQDEDEKEDEDEETGNDGSWKGSSELLTAEGTRVTIAAWRERAPEPVRRVAQWIERGTVKRILVLTGAGVSVAAGIPDFRTPGTGLYDNLAAYQLPYPEAVFDVAFYRRRPMPFVKLASELWPGNFCPTLTHSFIALLHQKGLLQRCYTQNIDGLEHLGE